MIYADSGVGKSRFILFLAACLAGGVNCLKWRIAAPRKVLYIDGELPGRELQNRILSAIKESGADIETVGENLSIWTEDVEGTPVPILHSQRGKAELLSRAKGFDLVVIDSMLTLMPPNGDSFKVESANKQNDVLKELKRLGCAVIVVHHSTKSGTYYGTINHNVLTSTTISLKKIQDEIPVDGLHFSLNFEKGRSLRGNEIEPLDVSCASSRWSFCLLAQTLEEKAIALRRNTNLSQKQIAEELGVAQGTVSKLLSKVGLSGRGSKNI